MPADEKCRPQLPFPVVEGVDYYVEGGRWVFTAAYHLRRGWCCGSGCRHCPFGKSSSRPVIKSQVEEPDG